MFLFRCCAANPIHFSSLSFLESERWLERLKIKLWERRGKEKEITDSIVVIGIRKFEENPRPRAKAQKIHLGTWNHAMIQFNTHDEFPILNGFNSNQERMRRGWEGACKSELEVFVARENPILIGTVGRPVLHLTGKTRRSDGSPDPRWLLKEVFFNFDP